jgi:hypothetical protein
MRIARVERECKGAGADHCGDKAKLPGLAKAAKPGAPHPASMNASSGKSRSLLPPPCHPERRGIVRRTVLRSRRTPSLLGTSNGLTRSSYKNVVEMPCGVARSDRRTRGPSTPRKVRLREPSAPLRMTKWWGQCTSPAARSLSLSLSSCPFRKFGDRRNVP